MHIKRWVIKLSILLAVLLVLSGFGLAFAAFSAAPSPRDIVNQMVSTLQAASNGHAVIAFTGSTPDKNQSGTVEIWAKKLANSANPTLADYAFRVEVRNSSDAKMLGDIAIGDGTNFWGYSPSQKTVWTGTVTQLMQMHNDSSSATPETPQALVQKLFDTSNVTLAGTETVAGHSAYKLQFVPQAGKVPQAAAEATGSLWVDSARSLPLQAALNVGSTGKGNITATEIELNTDISKVSFAFSIPAGVKVVPIQDLQPQHLTLNDADKAAGFKVLKPAYIPSGATLVDVLKVGPTIVLRYESSQGSFSITQGVQNKTGALRSSGQSVTIRGTTGTIYTGSTGKELSLVWSENGRTYSVSGALSSQDAVKIAQSLQ